MRSGAARLCPVTAPFTPFTTLDLLRVATDRFGRSPEEWLTAALAGADGPVLDIRCSADHPATRVRLRWARGGTGGGPDALGRADRLPVRTNAAAGVRATMCLPVLEPLDGLFAELRRVLRPTGTLAALVPSGSGYGPLRWHPSRAPGRALDRALTGHPGFRHQTARDHLAWLFHAADFAVLTDQRQVFWLPIPDADTAAAAVAGLVPAAVWPPDVEPERLRHAKAELTRLAGDGIRLPIPLRLLVGRR